MEIFESHAHYSDRKFDNDRKEILDSLEESGIKYVLEIASSYKNSLEVIDIASKYDYIYAAVGIHPYDVKYSDKEDILKLSELLKEIEKNKIVAVGEIGLDYHYDEIDKNKQKDFFAAQLDLAVSNNLPVIIHSREAAGDVHDIVITYLKKGLRGVMHCYADSLEFAREYTSYGLYLGIGGVVTYNNAKKLVSVAKDISLEHLLLETDAPYLSPEPKRGTRNDSRNLVYIAQKLAEIKGIDVSEVYTSTLHNAKLLFGVK